VQWIVDLHPVFESEFRQLSKLVARELLARVRLLETYGPELSRPHADTLNGSKHANMKELRFQAENGVWRIAFAFDPERKAILLVAGDKSRTTEKRFYKQLIHKADERFDQHLEILKRK
jgi:hypothetical protein